MPVGLFVLRYLTIDLLHICLSACLPFICICIYICTARPTHTCTCRYQEESRDGLDLDESTTMGGGEDFAAAKVITAVLYSTVQ